MKVILDIEEKRADFFLELLKSLDYIKILQEIKDSKKSQIIQNLIEAFEDVKAHEAGKIKLNRAKDFLNEL